MILSTLQQTFQIVLATDGKVSFAVFLYQDLERTLDITAGGTGVVGFDAGDQRRSIAILNAQGMEIDLKQTDIFRLDGMEMRYLLTMHAQGSGTSGNVPLNNELP